MVESLFKVFFVRCHNFGVLDPISTSGLGKAGCFRTGVRSITQFIATNH
jgi:hypothetical protein